MEVVLTGCTRYIQAADVSWIKSFKSKLQQYYDDFMVGDQLSLTAAGNLKAPPLELLCQWCTDAWNSVSESQIVASFQQCALDVSEDDLILAFRQGHACAGGSSTIATGAASVAIWNIRSGGYRNLSGRTCRKGKRR